MQKRSLTEALVGSFGIMCFGWLSIPLIGHFAGVAISTQQGAVMSACFFVLRVVWLYAVRIYFSKHHATCST